MKLKENIMNKSRGSLVGGAVGDALGYPVEFISSFEKIRTRYGGEGIARYDKNYHFVGESHSCGEALFSDDTQMMLYTAEALIEAYRSGTEVLPLISDAYLAWFGGQTGRKVKTAYRSELAGIVELNQQRAPGITCLTALGDIADGREPHNDSKGCGGVMRVAPVGIFGAAHGWSTETTGLVAGQAAMITHLHPMSTLSSSALAMIVQQCLLSDHVVDSSRLKAIIDDTLGRLSQMYGGYGSVVDKFKHLVTLAVSLEDSPLPDWEIIEKRLGGGWVAEETLAIALFSVLRHIDDFKRCMICSVNHGGDSDSTGAVAGNIIGAILGSEAIGEEFTGSLQLHDLIVKFADELTLSDYDDRK